MWSAAAPTTIQITFQERWRLSRNQQGAPRFRSRRSRWSLFRGEHGFLARNLVYIHQNDTRAETPDGMHRHCRTLMVYRGNVYFPYGIAGGRSAQWCASHEFCVTTWTRGRRVSGGWTEPLPRWTPPSLAPWMPRAIWRSCTGCAGWPRHRMCGTLILVRFLTCYRRKRKGRL